MRTISTGLYFITSAPTMAENRMPVPVDDSRFSVKIAASFVGLGTTGAIFSTNRCRPSIGNVGANRSLSQFFTTGKPHMKTKTDRIIHGVQARTRSAFECCTMAAGSLASEAETSWPLKEGEVQIFLGCQTRRNSTSETIETMAAMMSTNSGPMKFDTRYCGIANDRPVTKIAGQISIIALRPANAQINQKGTNNEKNGSCLPIMAVTAIKS